MTKQEKVTFVIDTLNTLYPQVPIPLDHKDPYTLLIAVLLSAQSTDVRVNKITPLLFGIADNPYDMVKLSVEEIREIIKPVGLSPMKSKGIHGLSEILIEKYNGQVPADFDALESLPAVGHKTASVVMSQAFNIPAFPIKAIDANGAGDMFAGAFLYGNTNGHSYEEAGKFASLAASKVVSKSGPRLELLQAQNLLREYDGR